MAGAYYFCCFVISVILNIIYFFKWHKHYSVYFTLLYLFVPIANFGYWQHYNATNLEQAILANKILYMGACYTPLAVILSTFFLCKIELGKIYHVLLFLFTTGIYISSLTVGYSGLYYRKVTWENINGHFTMVKEYGPCHILFYVMLVLYSIFGLSALVYSMQKKKDVSIKNTILLMAVMIITIISFLIGRAVGGVEMTTICYDIGLIIFLIISDRLVLYNIDDTVISALMQMGNVGVASFNIQHEFLGSNDVAKKYYPPIEKLRVDKTVDDTDEELNELKTWISQVEHAKELIFEYQRDDKYYSVSAQYLFVGSAIKGYHFIFLDRTEDKEREKYLEHMAIMDELTRTFNRRALENDIEKLEREDKKENLIFISFDLNGLKKANDTYGHVAGDELIKGAAECLRETIGKIGKVYRTGGDEFVCIIVCEKEVFSRELVQLDEQIRKWRGKYSKELALAKGIASITEFPDYSVLQLKKEADRRMYLDKDNYYEVTGIDRRR